MGALPVLNNDLSLTISSHRGPYTVTFLNNPFGQLAKDLPPKSVLIVDKNVSEIYQTELRDTFAKHPYLIIEANELTKDLTEFTQYAKQLTELKIRRDFTLVAIGGGVIQDITCFLASTMFRGMDWIFFPTTLLAQADSCIGSKSSINVGGIKNLMGTFLPPNKIFIATSFLNSLQKQDIFSGIGEMIKVHGIAGIDALKEFNSAYEKIMTDKNSMNEFIYKSLMHKKFIIEQDEFDTGIRNIMNYGHTFGHAIESATEFAIPHGISITIGQTMACSYGHLNKMISEPVYRLATDLQFKNYFDCRKTPIHFDNFKNSIKKDKKNVDSKIAVIIPVNDQFKIEKRLVEADEQFFSFCKNFFLNNGFSII